MCEIENPRPLQKIPSYVQSTAQYRAWMIFGVLASCWAMGRAMDGGAFGAPLAIGFPIMCGHLFNYRLIWKKQGRKSA